MAAGHLRVVACTPHVDPASFGSLGAFQELCYRTVAFSGAGEANGFPKVRVRRQSDLWFAVYQY